MKIAEIINEANGRREFLKKAGGLGLGIAAASAIPKTAQAGQYQPYDEIIKDRDSFERIWVPRYNDLQEKADRILKKLVVAAGPKYNEKFKDLEIKIVSDQRYAIANPEEQTVSLDLTVFWDASDEVLAVVIAHELGHIALDHTFTDIDVVKHSEAEKYRLAAVARQEELDADAFSIMLAKKLGYNKAVVFKFVHQQIEEYKYYETLLSHPNSSHPTFQQRINNARKLGFQLSQGGMQQMRTLITHLS